jgi:hypothetical protein
LLPTIRAHQVMRGLIMSRIEALAAAFVDNLFTASRKFQEVL